MANLKPSTWRHQEINYQGGIKQVDFIDTTPRIFQFKNYTSNTIYISKNIAELKIDTNGNVINEHEYDFKVEQNTTKVYVSVLPLTKLYITGQGNGLVELNSWECENIDSNDLDQTQQIIINKNSNISIFQTPINQYKNLIKDSSFENVKLGNDIHYGMVYSLISDYWNTDNPTLTGITKYASNYGKKCILLQGSNIYQIISLVNNPINQYIFTGSFYAYGMGNLTLNLQFLDYTSSILYQQSQTFNISSDKFNQYKLTVSVPTNITGITQIKFIIISDNMAYVDDCQLINYNDTAIYIPDYGANEKNLYLSGDTSINLDTLTTNINSKINIITNNPGTDIIIKDNQTYPAILQITNGDGSVEYLHVYIENNNLYISINNDKSIFQLNTDGSITFNNYKLASTDITQGKASWSGTTTSIPSPTSYGTTGEILQNSVGACIMLGDDGHVYAKNSVGNVVLLV